MTPERPVLVGVDATAAARDAVAAGRALADRLGTSVELVHATPDAWAIPTVSMSLPVRPDELNDAARHAARAAIGNALNGDAATDDQLARLLICTGRAAAVIRDVVAETDAQLVVLGGKHHSTLGRWVAGSTAHSLVRSLDVPLFVSAHGRLPIRRMLVAVDLSEAAVPTVDHALRFARALEAEVHVLHVVEPLPLLPETPLQLSDDDVYEHARQHLERHVWPHVDEARVTTGIRRGPSVDVIKEVVKERLADVVVVGSHGKGWVDRILIGSTTERVLSGLPASVLVVPVLGPANRRPTARAGRAGARPRSLTLEA